MTARLPDFPPVAVPLLPSATSWAGRKPPRAHTRPIDEVCDMVLAADDLAAVAKSMDAAQEAIFLANMQRRDQDAADYGEPKSPREFYHGRPGSQAEKCILDCLRALQAIPEADRLFADQFMDVIAREYLAAAKDGKTEIRRVTALLRIATEKVVT